MVLACWDHPDMGSILSSLPITDATCHTMTHSIHMAGTVEDTTPIIHIHPIFIALISIMAIRATMDMVILTMVTDTIRLACIAGITFTTITAIPIQNPITVAEGPVHQAISPIAIPVPTLRKILLKTTTETIPTTVGGTVVTAIEGAMVLQEIQVHPVATPAAQAAVVPAAVVPVLPAATATEAVQAVTVAVQEDANNYIIL